MAWLNATPKPDPRSRRADPKFARKEMCRSDRMKKDGVPILMPSNPAPELVNRLIEIGLTEANGVGVSPLSWVSIEAWQRLTGVTMPPWEARLHRHLSKEYVAEFHRAESENCPPPWRAEVTKREREIEQAQLERALG